MSDFVPFSLNVDYSDEDVFRKIEAFFFVTLG